MGETEVDPEEAIEVVERRADFLTHLEGRSCESRDLVEALDHSRSTVHRAVRELESAGLIERTGTGYVLTARGRLLLDAHRTRRRRVSAVVSSPLIDALGPQGPLAPAAFEGAETLVTGDEGPGPVERASEALRRADRVELLLGGDAPGDGAVATAVAEAAVDARTTVEAVVPEGSVDAFRGALADATAGRDPGAAVVAAVDLRAGETPPFTLLLYGTDRDRFAVVFHADGDARGALYNDSGPAAGWARSLYRDRREDAETVDVAAPRTDVGTGAGAGAGGDAPRAHGVGISPPPVGVAGFVRYDPVWLDRSAPASPLTAWRTGFSVADIHAGHALARECPPDAMLVDDGGGAPDPGTAADASDRRSATAGAEAGGARDGSAGERVRVASVLDARLHDGEGVVVLGPPGAGKSTVCRGAIARWLSAGRGTVFHRRGDTPDPFDRVGALADELADAEGHALVVVEAAGSADPEAVFDLVRRFRGDPSVTVLLEAGERAWRDPETEPTAPRLLAEKRRLTALRVPPVDRRECERAVEAFEAATGRTVPVSPAELLADVHTDSGAGEMALLGYRLTARHAVDDDPPSGLSAAVAAAYETLATADVAVPDGSPDLPLQVGLLVNALAAAGGPVRPELLHAVADDDAGHRAVDATLDLVDGELVFGLGEDGAYRTNHRFWAAEFLRHALDRDERGTVAAFERAVSSTLALADDAAARTRVRRWLRGDAPFLDRLADEPTGTADELVAWLFDLARRRAALAPLVGTADTSRIELPSACSPARRLACAEDRGRAWLAHGELDRAAAAFDRLDTAAADATDLSPAERARLRAGAAAGRAAVARTRGDLAAAEASLERALELAREAGDRGEEAARLVDLGEVARARGEHETAADRFEAARELAEGLGDDRCVADCLRGVGRLARERGDLDTAERRLSTALETYGPTDDRGARAALHDDLGVVASMRGDLDLAAERFGRALELYREAGDRAGAADALDHLGIVAQRREAFAVAERRHRRAYEEQAAVGNRAGMANTANQLGVLALRRGNLADAAEWLGEALELYRALENRGLAANTAMNLGIVAHRRGEFDRAAERYRESLETYRDLGARNDEGRLLGNLGELELDRGNLAAAEEHLQRALELREEAGDREGVATVTSSLGALALERGDLEAAEERLERALDGKREVGDAFLGPTLRRLARVALERDDLEAAERRASESLRRSEEADERRDAALSRVTLARVRRERGDLDGAAAACETAVDTLADLDAYHEAIEAAELGAEVREAAGDLEGARNCCERGVDIAAEAGQGFEDRRTALRRRCEAIGGDGTGPVDAQSGN